MAVNRPAIVVFGGQMNNVLSDLQPVAVWKQFEALSAIPRSSGKEAAARAYVLSQAARLNLEAHQDAVGNVIIRKPARPGRESAPTALLQAHLDMVCEKNEGVQHNFDTDPIRMVHDGDWLRADGTTLGADNGIGVATALAVMESNDIAHGPLEFVFTIDEETGLTGAVEFKAGVLQSRYYLNMDAEEEGTLCIGCAGAVNTTATTKVKRVRLSAGSAWQLKVSGLKGGHSGVDIHQGRGNAVRILGRTLQRLLQHLPVQIAELAGGSRRNVIPREASALIVLDSASEGELKSLVAMVEAELRSELGSFDPDLRLALNSATLPASVLDSHDARKTVDLIASLHHGVLAMSPDIPGLVQTSTNLATISTRNDEVEIGTSQRSAIESSKSFAAGMVATVCRLAGFDVTFSGSYPGWKPEPESELVRKLQGVHEELYGKKAELVAMHAGLECGVIGEKYPGMQMVAFGPQIVDVHSPSERVKISSVGSFWTFLKTALERL
jgi:dipeptidase D